MPSWLESINSNNLLTATKFESGKCLYLIVVFLFSLFVSDPFQYTDLSNPLLRSFDDFCLPFADKVTIGTCNFVSCIVKITLLELPSLLTFGGKIR